MKQAETLPLASKPKSVPKTAQSKTVRSNSQTVVGSARNRETMTSAGQPMHDSVLGLVHVLSRQIGRAFDGELEARFGLNHAEWRVMLTLAAAPGVTSVEIIECWSMDKMAVSRAVGGLERRGYVRRKQNKQDRRRYSLTLTSQGKKAYAWILPHTMARHRELLDCISANESAALKRILRKLNDRAMTLALGPIENGPN